MTGVLVSAQGMCVYLPVYLGLSAQGVSCGGGICLGVCPEGVCWGCLVVGWVGVGSALGCLPGWGVSYQVGVYPVGCMCLPDGGGLPRGCLAGGCLPGWGVSAQVGVCPVACMCLPDGGSAIHLLTLPLDGYQQ